MAAVAFAAYFRRFRHILLGIYGWTHAACGMRRGSIITIDISAPSGFDFQLWDGYRKVRLTTSYFSTYLVYRHMGKFKAHHRYKKLIPRLNNWWHPVSTTLGQVACFKVPSASLNMENKIVHWACGWILIVSWEPKLEQYVIHAMPTGNALGMVRRHPHYVTSNRTFIYELLPPSKRDWHWTCQLPIWYHQ